MTTPSEVLLADTLARLALIIPPGEFDAIVAEVKRRMGDGGFGSLWLRTLGDVLAERHPEAAHAWRPDGPVQ